MRKIRREDLVLVFYAVISKGATARTIYSKYSSGYRCVLDSLVCLGLSLGKLLVLLSLAFEELGACVSELLHSDIFLLIEFIPHNVLHG